MNSFPQDWTESMGRKFKDKAVLTTILASMPTPKNFKDYVACVDQLLRLPERYHDLWYPQDAPKMPPKRPQDAPRRPHEGPRPKWSTQGWIRE